MPPSRPPRQTPVASDALRAALTAGRILLLDPTRSLPELLRNIDGVSLTIARYSALDSNYLADCRPDMVLAPLVAKEFDVLDLTRRLREIGYAGALRAYCHPLPNVQLIRAEVRHIWPELDFDILEVVASET